MTLDVREPTPASSSEASAARDPTVERELAATRAALTDLRCAWEEWLRVVSHDLRGPLTLLLGYADSLQHNLAADPDPTRLRHDVQAIRAAARRLNKMVDQVVDGGRLVVGTASVQPMAVDLLSLARGEVAKARRLYPDHHFRTDLPADLPLVLADPRRLGQILAALLSNAAVFSPPGSLVRLAARRQGDQVILSVVDRGVGIAPDELPHVFDRSYRPERLRDARREGLGLSLTTARGLAELMGARLWLESKGVDLGSTARLALPVAPSSGQG